jgi:hypothetical protein
VAKDLERFVEDRTPLGEDWAATNPATFVVLDLWLRDTHHPRHTGRSCKIILSSQQATLLCDTRRVAKPGTDDVQRELALEVRLLSSGCD